MSGTRVIEESDYPTPVRVTVVICTRDRPESVERCLAGLAACSTAPFETIVVDNAPVRHRAEAVATEYGARYIQESRVGLSRARNAGLRSATGDVVAFIDDDASPHRHWVAAITRAFDNRAVGVVAGEIAPAATDPDPGAYHVGERRVIRRAEPLWFEIASFGGVGNGGNMSFRRNAVMDVGGFDERLGLGSPLPGFEDHDAFMRVIEAGYSAVSDPSVVVFHDGSGRDSRQRAAEQYQIAFPYFVFLLMEKPVYRGKVLRYAVEAFFGKRRPWRERAAASLLTPGQRIIALLAVPHLAWRTLVRSLDSSTPAGLPH